MTTEKQLLIRWSCACAISMAVLGGCAQILEIDKEFVSTGRGGAGGGTNAGGDSGSGGGTIACGNGVLEAGEACDDGNNADKDGCTYCTIDECYICSNAPGTLSTCGFSVSGTPCQSTKVCDGASKCVECVEDMQCESESCGQNVCAKCDDMLKNGDETDVDCGGMHCAKCAIGKTCGKADDCASTFCVDGICCGDACDGACQACNIAGSEGVCDFIPRYADDLFYGAGMSCKTADGKTCNGGGNCAKALGQPCTAPAECASTKCVDNDGDMIKTCVKTTGDSCTANGECFNLMCDPGTMMCL